MSGPARLLLFGIALSAVFAGAVLLGGSIDPPGSVAEEGHADSESEHGRQGEPGRPSPPGLAIAQDGYRLVVEPGSFNQRKAPQRLRFRILDSDGQAVKRFDVEHEKRMHLIVVRRDLADFQHLHPTLSADGTWTARPRFAGGGTYRIFTDFSRAGEQHTLGADLQVSGEFSAPRRTARTAGDLEVALRAGEAHAGRENPVAFEVRDGGRRVNDRLEPYLGAKGHLVALREGDLAYLHTHPEEDQLAFMTTYPSPGSYRLFVQFSYRGRVRTAEFTQEVER